MKKKHLQLILSTFLNMHFVHDAHVNGFWISVIDAFCPPRSTYSLRRILIHFKRDVLYSYLLFLPR
jgi:hypothetical protein